MDCLGKVIKISHFINNKHLFDIIAGQAKNLLV